MASVEKNNRTKQDDSVILLDDLDNDFVILDDISGDVLKKLDDKWKMCRDSIELIEDIPNEGDEIFLVDTTPTVPSILPDSSEIVDVRNQGEEIFQLDTTPEVSKEKKLGPRYRQVR